MKSCSILGEAKILALVKSVRFFTSLSITAFCALALAPLVSFAQETPTPTPSPSASPTDEEIQPTFETQKLARTYVLDIPAPRGQITDRNGEPLAQNKLGYTLAIVYPTPLDFTDVAGARFCT